MQRDIDIPDPASEKVREEINEELDDSLDVVTPQGAPMREYVIVDDGDNKVRVLRLSSHRSWTTEKNDPYYGDVIAKAMMIQDAVVVCELLEARYQAAVAKERTEVIVRSKVAATVENIRLNEEHSLL